MARKAHRQSKKHVDANHDDTYDSSTSHNTTDEEYFALIAGGADDDDDDDAAQPQEVEQPWMTRVREAFEVADENADGALSLKEARNLFLATTMSGEAGPLPGRIGAVATSTVIQSERLDVLEAKMDRIIQLLEEQHHQRIR